MTVSGPLASITSEIECAARNNDPVDSTLRAKAREIVRRGDAELGVGKATTVLATWNPFGSWLSQDTRQISADVDKCRRVASPVRSIPAEVWEEIFLHCTQAEMHPITLWHLPEQPMTITPWSLTAVCRRWRQIALSHQPLWTRIHAVAFTTGAGNKRSRLLRNANGDQRMDLILARGGNAPLEVSIGWLDGWGSTEIPVIFLTMAPRLRVLEFKAAPTFDQVNADSRLGPFLEFLSTQQEKIDFSRLEEARLQFGAAPIDGIQMLRSATNLRKLTIISNFLFQSICLSSLPDQLDLAKLRYLQINDSRLPTEVLYNIICHSPSLEVLYITMSSLSISWLDPSTLPSSCTLANLRKLLVVVHGDLSSVDDMLWWAERVHLPKLQEFTLVTDGARPVWRCPDSQLRTVAASHVLERLTLDVNIYTADMLRMLQSLPNLQHLELRNVCPASLILGHFASGALLPALKSLRCGVYPLRIHDLLEMILQRTAISPFSEEARGLDRVELVVLRPDGKDGKMTIGMGPDALKALTLLDEKGWKMRLNPSGWQERVLTFTSAVALIDLYKNTT